VNEPRPATEFHPDSIRVACESWSSLKPSKPEPDPDRITAAEAIYQAMTALGGIRTRIEVELWISNHVEQQWADIGTAMADLTYPGNDSSRYKPEERFLERVSIGRYRLRGQPPSSTRDR
jgi:hypothetical protein